MTVSLNGLAALAYAARLGWKVFPVVPQTKRPVGWLVPNGYLDATTDAAQITKWWTSCPTALVGIPARPNGLVIIDVDAYKPDCEFPALEKRLGTLPETPRVLSPRGGTHYYLLDQVGSYSGTACPGVDVKSDGYVVAPPSAGYRWDLGAHVLETPIAALPDAWLRHLTRRDRPRPRVPAGLDPLCSVLGAAFGLMGWLGDELPDGKRMARCPWLSLHTDGRGDGKDSSTVIFAAGDGQVVGGFHCAHGHCAGRGWRDVLDQIPTKVKNAAALMVRDRMRSAS